MGDRKPPKNSSGNSDAHKAKQVKKDAPKVVQTDLDPKKKKK